MQTTNYSNCFILTNSDTQRNLMREILNGKKQASKEFDSLDANSTVLSLPEYEAVGVEGNHHLVISSVNQTHAVSMIRTYWNTSTQTILVSAGFGEKKVKHDSTADIFSQVTKLVLDSTK